MRSGRSFLGVVALLAAARLGADSPAGRSLAGARAADPRPPLVAVNPPAPAPQAARGPEAITLFGRLDDDRSAVFIASGAPDARVTVRCPDTFRTLEVWTYLEHPTLGKNARIVFYPESPTGTYRYWTVLEGERVLLAPCGEGGPGGGRGGARRLRGRAPRRLGREGHLAPPGRQQRRPRRARAPSPCRTSFRRPARSAEAPPTLLVSNKPLTGKERKKLMAELPEKYRQFLTDVEPIITDVERDTLLKLGEDYQREHFIDDFWKRRSLAPDGMRIAFRDIYELRLQQAKELFRNTNTDQGRIYLVNGPPDGIRKIDCQDVYWPIQIWYYERLESLHLSKVLLLFYQPFGAGDYRMWTPLDGPQAIVAGGLPGALGAGAARRVDFGALPGVAGRAGRDQHGRRPSFGQAGALKLADDIRQGPKPDVEGADHILQMTTDLQAGAATLPLQRVFRFPEAIGSRMRMELAVLLERDSLTKKQIGEETFFDVDVVGEVVRDGRLIDNFRYRFDFPASTVSGPFVPLTVERDLYPGEYRLKVKVSDANRNAAALISEKLKVPDTPDATISAEEKAAREAARKAVTELVENSGPKGSLSLIPIAREIATGLIRFETRASSNDIAFTEFYLNNTRIVTKRRPPFAADLDLGELPRKHVVKVIGYAKDGKPIAQDEVIAERGPRGLPPPHHAAREGREARGADAHRGRRRRARDEAAHAGGVLRERPPRGGSLPGAVSSRSWTFRRARISGSCASSRRSTTARRRRTSGTTTRRSTSPRRTSRPSSSTRASSRRAGRSRASRRRTSRSSRTPCRRRSTASRSSRTCRSRSGSESTRRARWRSRSSRRRRRRSSSSRTS